MIRLFWMSRELRVDCRSAGRFRQEYAENVLRAFWQKCEVTQAELIFKRQNLNDFDSFSTLQYQTCQLYSWQVFLFTSEILLPGLITQF